MFCESQQEGGGGQAEGAQPDWLFHVRRVDMEHVRQVYEKLSLLLAALALAVDVTFHLLDM